MPVIAIVNPKGGVGKSTTALLLSTTLARGTKVTLLDADPNRPQEEFAAGGNVPANLTIVSDVDEDNIADKIEEASAAAPFVVVDLEGTAAKIVVLAIQQADLVIIPCGGSQLDARQAGRAVRLVQQQEKALGRVKPGFKLPFAIVFTKTNPVIRTKMLKHVEDTFKKAGFPLFQVEVHDRQAFNAMMAYKLPLHELSPNEVSNLDKAIENAEGFAQEVINVLRGVKNQTSEQHEQKEVA